MTDKKVNIFYQEDRNIDTNLNEKFCTYLPKTSYPLLMKKTISRNRPSYIILYNNYCDMIIRTSDEELPLMRFHESAQEIIMHRKLKN